MKAEKKGFTLVEIMIVMAIIGLLAAVGLPNMFKAGRKARMSRFAREIKTAAHAFAQYSFETAKYPADTLPSQMPEGMSSYLSKFPWSEETAIGGQWDWDYKQFGIEAGVSVYQPNWSNARMLEVDELMDDGNLATGQFRARAGGYIYIIEE